MLSATLELCESACTFGAFGGVPSTISLPFQWNQIGTTRGVPSRQMYARRAGEVDRSNSCATGSSSNAKLPCFVAILFFLSAACSSAEDFLRKKMRDGRGEGRSDDQQDQPSRAPLLMEPREPDEDVGHVRGAVAHVREDRQDEEPERKIEGDRRS